MPVTNLTSSWETKAALATGASDERKNKSGVGVLSRLRKSQQQQLRMCDIPKPKMRGLLASQIRRHVIIGSLFAFSNSLAYKVFVADKRKQVMRDYYLDYDPDVSLDQMRKHMESTGSWKPGK
ncbi:hypothetical protein TSAR_015503 [Trichomalopsis sarcophagae]|uniref:Uncharacterized protein n=1 Tax=Trichomalopsis sarcophagae TaxID=543379 RepID=A0A232EWW4_9HYME|nr:hypothetical protein TSAR_015503 [Trichomalopsis sarcophagae]